MSERDLDSVLDKLRSWRLEVVQCLRTPGSRQEGIQMKRELDRAIECLEFCQKYDIRTNSSVIVIPNPVTMTPSSEFRLIEDNETDDRQQWLEVSVNGEFIRPFPGSLIIERIA